MMKMSKRMKLGFCLLISMFLVSQITAAQYFLICTEKGLKIYSVSGKNWQAWDYVRTLEKDSGVSSAGFNSDGTLFYTHSSKRSAFADIADTIHFYEVPKYGNMRAITTPTVTIEKGMITHIYSAGFNPNDRTFYICCQKSPKRVVNVFELKDTSLKFLYQIKDFSPSSIVFSPADKTTLIGFFGPGIFIYRSKLISNLSNAENKEPLDLSPHSMHTIGFLLKGGFSPDGTVFFVLSHNRLIFYKVEKMYNEHGNLYLGGFYDGTGEAKYHNGGFLDNEHFFICSNLGVKIYQVPSCNTWEKDSISESSFKEIKVLENGVPCSAAVLSPVYTTATQDNIKELSTDQDKAKKTYSDATIHIQAD